MVKYCEFCNGPWMECNCAEMAEYYENLTPEEWAEEQRMIAQYVAETEENF